MGDVSPTLDYREDRGTGEKRVKPKANFHLVSREAIRVFMKGDEDDHFIRSLDLDPASLLGKSAVRELTDNDLRVSLTLLLREVAPLLAEDQDVSAIVPGLMRANEKPTYWSTVECEVIVRGVRIQDLHRVAHPLTGLAQGTTKRKLELKTLDNKFRIEIENVSRPVKQHNDSSEIMGIRVGLTFKGSAMRGTFGSLGKFFRSDDASPERLLRFRLSDLATVHFNEISKLEGIYLPRPTEWIASDGRRVTPARVVALMAAVTGMPAEQLRLIHDELRPPSTSTRKRMNKALEVEMGCLVAAPIASWLPAPASVQVTREVDINTMAIDPRIERVYGEGRKS
ncbi:MAG: hypothetical protein EON58_08070 [Alphaproteobacteria bacterium]|nr:MAG: hypothetical protein EON58_08070 [Alphaproteobacteria bacterium]